MNTSLHLVLIFLGAAVCIVPLLQRAGLGAVLGYIAAGIIVGPSVLGLVSDPLSILHFAEFGVVMLFFVIGLALQPSRIWAMRRSIFAMGAVQFGASGTVLFVLAMFAGLGAPAACALAVAMALSSTAATIAALEERRELSSRKGRTSTALLMFQSIALVLSLAALPWLAPRGALTMQVSGSWLLDAAKPIALLLALAGGGRLLLRPFLRMIAATRNEGLMTAAALFVLVGTSFLLQAVGLSMALGALIAGSLLGDSEFRHELEARITPFKELLVGLFFLAIGMSLDMSVVLDRSLLVLGLTAVLVVTKFIVTFLVVKAFGLESRDAVDVAIGLAQGGESSFIILQAATASGILAAGFSNLAIAVGILSMATSPLLSAASRYVRRARNASQDSAEDSTSRRLRIFLSYSRKDAEAATKLVAVLEDEGFDVALDTRDLPFGEDWRNELDYYIRQADAALWLVSPSSVRSEWCAWELARVAEHRKRLVPVVLDRVPDHALPEAIASIQLLPREGNFELANDLHVRQLIDTLKADRRWLKEHTRLGERARLWTAAGRSVDWLLRGAELDAAVQWRDQRPPDTPGPGAPVLDLIHASRSQSDRDIIRPGPRDPSPPPA